MMKKKLEPGLVSCNYVLTFCSKHKQGMVAMEFLMVMKKVRGFFGGGGRLWIHGSIKKVVLGGLAWLGGRFVSKT